MRAGRRADDRAEQEEKETRATIGAGSGYFTPPAAALRYQSAARLASGGTPWPFS